MGLLGLASGDSLWRGYDYFKEKKVSQLQKNGDSSFSPLVIGTRKAPYDVEIDVEHPRKSKCNCPKANGKRIVCKHMIAVYFSAFPDEAEQFYNEAVAYEEEQEKQQEQLEEKLISYVGKMKKEDLRQALLELLFDGPEWQYDRFIREHLDEI